MPRLTNETFGAGDQSWLGSTHGIYNGRTETLNLGAFNATNHYPGGFIRSGTPVAKVSGLLVPYDKTEGTTTGAGVLAGFILTDQRVVGTGNIAVPVLDHGRIRVDRVPYAGGFTAPVAGAKHAGTQFTYTGTGA